MADPADSRADRHVMGVRPGAPDPDRI